MEPTPYSRGSSWCWAKIEASVILRKEWQGIKSRVAYIKTDAEQMEISPTLVELLIIAEDHRFGSHPGVDLLSLCRAVWRTLFCGKREGGSTIAMQFVRVITGRYERTIGRKIAEIYLALRLTKQVPKSDIPKLYLSVAYFGWRMNGLKQASSRLNINPASLSLLDSANIIARLKYPEPRLLDNNRLAKIDNRVRYIIKRYDYLLGTPSIIELSMSEGNGTI
jgi:membrane carboxypeptidase/penicillin-binding protein PbpC